ncbi:MAG TPA: NAD-dependent epimerase/dehydratase family protein [Rhodanobacteraceae bacterium]|nr:NAD-dependent epimerase/dehydratase family protein [Rhodanobacteraceae bacterium]
MTRDPAFAPVLVFGASSQIGFFLLPMLVERGARVLAVSRRAHADQAAVTWLRGDLPEQPPQGAAEVESIVSFGPMDALAAWLEGNPLPALRRVVATSSMSAESKRQSRVPAERALARRLREAEAALASACDRHGVAWTVLRPTLIYGAGMDRSLTPLARRAARTRVFALPPGRGLRQPVHAQDIALAVIAALERPASAGRVIPIGGGERLPAARMFARVRESLPVRTCPVPVPRLAASIAQRLLPKLRGPLSRLDQDLVADNGELERLLEVHPRGFAPDARMWNGQAGATRRGR